MTLADLATSLASGRLLGDGTVEISDLAYDSRQVMPGTLFVAIPGGYADGHEFVDQAIDRGATAIMVERELPYPIPQLIVPDTRRELANISARFFDNPSQDLRVVGITGTDGKTTTSYILDHILRSAGRITGMVGTVSVRIADQTVDHETRQTTPESLDIQRFLRQMVSAGVDTAILEATSHGLDLHRLDQVAFRTAIVTNITQEHLEHHRTKEAYWRAKAKLFEAVAAETGVAVVNLDDEGARSVLPWSEGVASVMTYTMSDQQASIRATIDQSGLSGSHGTISIDGTRYKLELPLIGAFNVSNALAAIGGAIAVGIAAHQAIDAVRTVPPIPGRMAIVVQGQPFGVVVDYAHTPESLEKVLRLLRIVRPGGRLIVVFGSAGERDRVKRPIQGRIAATLADIVIVTNEDPRYEDAASIVDEIAAGAELAGAVPDGNLFRIVERRDAIALAFDMAQPQDTILLAGKGHERSIIWNGVKVPWNEEGVARELLRERGWISPCD